VARAAEIKVVGFDQLISGSTQLAKKVDRGANRELLPLVEQRAQLIQNVLPRDSGRLAGSLRTHQAGDRVRLAMGGPELPYAGWIEFGGIREGGRGSWAERPYLPHGRYFWPLTHVVELDRQMSETAGKAASDEIRRFSWPKPKE
jgi:hypothetical protein